MSSRPIDILLVEDNPGDVRLMRESFREARVDTVIHHVADGTEVLAYLRRQGMHLDAIRPDIVLLDLNLPGRDGRAVLRDIKTDPELKSIPVVVLTSSSAPEDVEHSYRAHANCFITKPVEFDRFVDVVLRIESFWFHTVQLPQETTA